MYFRNFLLVVLELFSVFGSPPNFLFIPAALAFEAPCPSALVLRGPTSSHSWLWGLHEDFPLAVDLKSQGSNLACVIAEIPLSSVRVI